MKGLKEWLIALAARLVGPVALPAVSALAGMLLGQLGVPQVVVDGLLDVVRVLAHSSS